MVVSPADDYSQFLSWYFLKRCPSPLPGKLYLFKTLCLNTWLAGGEILLMLCYEGSIIQFPRLLGKNLNYCHLAQGFIFHFAFYWASLGFEGGLFLCQSAPGKRVLLFPQQHFWGTPEQLLNLVLLAICNSKWIYQVVPHAHFSVSRWFSALLCHCTLLKSGYTVLLRLRDGKQTNKKIRSGKPQALILHLLLQWQTAGA